MDQITYLFIDAKYVQEIYQQAMEKVFGSAAGGEIDFEIIKGQAVASRAFIYDCLDDTKREKETEEEFAARVEAQEEYSARIRALRGVHLQLGTLTGKRRRRQKEVDILLAVDMLTHGFNRNMNRAVLLAGDLDFRPIVEALARAGVFVEVWYERTSTARELPWAADFGYELTWGMLYSWSTGSFRWTHELPRVDRAHSPVSNALELNAGSCDGRPALLMKVSGGPYVLRVDRSDGVLWLEHDDQGVLERYFSVMFGRIDWKH